MTPGLDNSDLLLTAFRYVSGELPVGDAAEFESVLAEDQAARDALADVVELSEAVAVEEFDRVHSLRTKTASPSRRVLSRWGAIVAVGLLAAACIIALNSHRPPDVSGTVVLGPGEIVERAADPLSLAVTEEAPSVLTLWSALGGDHAGLFGSDSFLSDEPEMIAPADSEVPNWMLTAVLGGTDEPAADLMDDPDHENL